MRKLFWCQTPPGCTGDSFYRHKAAVKSWGGTKLEEGAVCFLFWTFLSRQYIQEEMDQFTFFCNSWMFPTKNLDYLTDSYCMHRCTTGKTVAGLWLDGVFFGYQSTRWHILHFVDYQCPSNNVLLFLFLSFFFSSCPKKSIPGVTDVGWSCDLWRIVCVWMCNSWSGSFFLTEPKRISLKCFCGQLVLKHAALNEQFKDLGDANSAMCSVHHYLFFYSHDYADRWFCLQPVFSTASAFTKTPTPIAK